jgi:hypothetical protein
MQTTLPSFRETRYGYESVSRDGEHTYLITFNGISYDVTHYWAQNPNGWLIARVNEIHQAPQTARNHYATLGR